MKLGLRGERADGALPQSLASRVSAWAKESLLARAVAIVGGLVVLSVIGESALARSARIPATALVSPDATDGGATLAPPVVAASASGIAAMNLGDAGQAAPVASAASPPPAAEDPPATQAREEASATGAGAAPRSRASPDDPVFLNAAKVDDLRRLPGVGAKRAEAILALRARLPGGRFHQIEDLLKVKGIGRSMLKKLHPLVRIV